MVKKSQLRRGEDFRNWKLGTTWQIGLDRSINWFFKIYLFYLFIFGCIGSLLLCVGFVQLRGAGATLGCGVQAFHCGGFSCCGAQALGTQTSVVVVCGLSSCGTQALDCRLSSCGAWAQLLHGVWDLPRPGLESVSPALAGIFLTTAPPGKLNKLFLRKDKVFFFFYNSLLFLL